MAGWGGSVGTPPLPELPDRGAGPTGVGAPGGCRDVPSVWVDGVGLGGSGLSPHPRQDRCIGFGGVPVPGWMKGVWGSPGPQEVGLGLGVSQSLGGCVGFGGAPVPKGLDWVWGCSRFPGWCVGFRGAPISMRMCWVWGCPWAQGLEVPWSSGGCTGFRGVPGPRNGCSVSWRCPWVQDLGVPSPEGCTGSPKWGAFGGVPLSPGGFDGSGGARGQGGGSRSPGGGDGHGSVTGGHRAGTAGSCRRTGWRWRTWCMRRRPPAPSATSRPPSPGWTGASPRWSRSAGTRCGRRASPGEPSGVPGRGDGNTGMMPMPFPLADGAAPQGADPHRGFPAPALRRHRLCPDVLGQGPPTHPTLLPLRRLPRRLHQPVRPGAAIPIPAP